MGIESRHGSEGAGLRTARSAYWPVMDWAENTQERGRSSIHADRSSSPLLVLALGEPEDPSCSVLPVLLN